MNETPTRRSPLYEAHEEAGARFTDFGGWEMPVSFAGIQEEHGAVRSAAGVFDVSHMGEIEVTGPEAEALTDRLTTNDVAALEDGEAQYAAITNADGTMLDDTVVYRRGPESFLFVPNAGHDAEMERRWTGYRDEWGLDASVENATERYAMLAVQGPDAPGIVADEAASDVSSLGRFEFAETVVAGAEGLVARTGYTGEDGFEVVAPWDGAIAVWDALAGAAEPCGLGARDTLRTEMGYLLSGQDFHPSENPRNPFEADVGFAVDLGTEFVGREALARIEGSGGPPERIAGFVLEERGVPRHGYAILDADGGRVGEVTSGTMSPTLSEPIGLGYLPRELVEPGTRIQIEIRGEPKPATVRETPFVDPGWRDSSNDRS